MTGGVSSAGLSSVCAARERPLTRAGPASPARAPCSIGCAGRAGPRSRGSRLLDGVAVPDPHCSTEPARPRHRRRECSWRPAPPSKPPTPPQHPGCRRAPATSASCCSDGPALHVTARSRCRRARGVAPYPTDSFRRRSGGWWIPLAQTSEGGQGATSAAFGLPRDRCASRLGRLDRVARSARPRMWGSCGRDADSKFGFILPNSW